MPQLFPVLSLQARPRLHLLGTGVRVGDRDSRKASRAEADPGHWAGDRGRGSESHGETSSAPCLSAGQAVTAGWAWAPRPSPHPATSEALPGPARCGWRRRASASAGPWWRQTRRPGERAPVKSASPASLRTAAEPARPGGVARAVCGRGQAGHRKVTGPGPRPTPFPVLLPHGLLNRQCKLMQTEKGKIKPPVRSAKCVTLTCALFCV